MTASGQKRPSLLHEHIGVPIAMYKKRQFRVRWGHILRNRRRTPLQLTFPFPSVGERSIHPPRPLLVYVRGRPLDVECNGDTPCTCTSRYRLHVSLLQDSSPLERPLKISVAQHWSVCAYIASSERCISLRAQTLSSLAFWVPLQLGALWSFIGSSLCVQAPFFRPSLNSGQIRTDIYYISFPKDKTVCQMSRQCSVYFGDCSDSYAGPRCVRDAS